MSDQVDADLFEFVYSPRRVRFWLRHWCALEALAESPSTSEGEAERLRREWELLQDRRGFDCLCRQVREWPEVPASPGGGRHMASAEHPWSDLIVDLERGAEDGLLRSPALLWRVTRDICAEMGLVMLERWQWRYSVASGHAGETIRKPILDPAPTFDQAAHIMAHHLGWLPYPDRIVMLTTG